MFLWRNEEIIPKISSNTYHICFLPCLQQSILEYVRAIYDTVLKEDVLPAHVHYLYGLLDGLAKKNNVESNILHTWKSEM